MQPIVGLYAVKSVTPAYFPVFNAVLAERWIKYLSENKEKIDYIFLDTCEGGMLCPPDDKICPEKQEELISLAKSLFSTAYEKETAACRHYVFKAIR